MSAYYNEFDPKAAAWLRELIRAGHLPAGDVDERSIENVEPREIAGYTQCHFFAGIGGWPYALALAGWPDDRPVWTGSCPCQPFSAAGKGAGFDDQRHLWPAWFHLIRECHPAIVFGEQVASKAANAWIDLVQADVEGMGYAFGCVPFPAASVGAPHIRDRNYWVGHSQREGLERLRGRHSSTPGQRPRAVRPAAPAGESVRMADSPERGRREERQNSGRRAVGDCTERQPAGLMPSGNSGGLADAAGARHAEARQHQCGSPPFSARSAEHGGMVRPTGPLDGFWRAADWLRCRDGKWRPVEPGAFPLAHGLPARVVRLRGYGNAIVPQQAAAFIEAAIAGMSEVARFEDLL